ncbi:hypothetical protein [Streptomyces sp. NPDC002078]
MTVVEGKTTYELVSHPLTRKRFESTVLFEVTGDIRYIERRAERPDAPYAVEGCAGVNSTYKIRVGRSTSVTGPYTERTGKPMLEGGGDLFPAPRSWA